MYVSEDMMSIGAKLRKGVATASATDSRCDEVEVRNLSSDGAGDCGDSSCSALDEDELDMES